MVGYAFLAIAWPLPVAGATDGAARMAREAPGVVAPERDPQQRYEADRALCISGLTHQQRQDCLREAAAARDAARRGGLEDEEADFRRNAIRRCDALPERDRQACIARMRDGSVHGHVEEGGVYRERREFAPPPAPPAVVPDRPVPGMTPEPAPAGRWRRE